MTAPEAAAALFAISGAIRRVRTRSTALSRLDSLWLRAALGIIDEIAQRVSDEYPKPYVVDQRLDPDAVAEALLRRLRFSVGVDAVVPPELASGQKL